MTALTVSALGVTLGRREILRGVDFSVYAGEFFVVIGPNGSGKTTLLKAMAGLAPFCGGAIEVLGRPLRAWPRKELARRVAVVSQEVPQDFPFRVGETVLMGRAPHLGLWGAEAQADRDAALEAMRFTGVSHLAGRRLDRLSGGERQLVFIARAICQSPQLLLLDEPTAALDPAHQIRILDLVEELRARKGVTVVMVSHDLNMAGLYADRLLLLSDGEVAALGTARQVLTAQQLEAIYHCRLLVEEGTLAKAPRVTPIPLKHRIGEEPAGDEAL